MLLLLLLLLLLCPVLAAAVRKKPDAAEREGMPMVGQQQLVCLTVGWIGRQAGNAGSRWSIPGCSAAMSLLMAFASIIRQYIAAPALHVACMTPPPPGGP